MLAAVDIRQKAERLWHSGRVLRALQGEEDLFPWRISTGKPTASQLLNNFAAVAEWIQQLQQDTHYSVEMTNINHRQMGQQQLPSAIVFHEVQALLTYLGKQKVADTYQQCFHQIVTAQPQLRAWCLAHPLKVIEQASHWSGLLNIITWLQSHPRPGCYLREMDIEGIDSKFIEQHRRLLSQLLDATLEPDAIDNRVTGLAQHGFERRYGLNYDSPLIRFRCLNNAIADQFGGINDISLPLAQFQQIAPDWDTVYITENKINGLSFPQQPSAIVIFGLGYGINALKDIDWLARCKVIYWGDIDTHGFSILSQLRSYHPHTRSLLMDEKTLMQFKSLWGQEPEGKRCTHTLVHLNKEEQILYQQLLEEYYAPQLRLEQERIAYHWLIKHL